MIKYNVWWLIILRKLIKIDYVKKNPFSHKKVHEIFFKINYVLDRHTDNILLNINYVFGSQWVDHRNEVILFKLYLIITLDRSNGFGIKAIRPTLLYLHHHWFWLLLLIYYLLLIIILIFFNIVFIYNQLLRSYQCSIVNINYKAEMSTPRGSPVPTCWLPCLLNLTPCPQIFFIKL